MAVLLSEGASLTVRETLTVPGASGIRADVLPAGRLPIGAVQPLVPPADRGSPA